VNGASSAPIRVLTWNIHAGIGADGRYDLDRTVGLIARQAPDVVALQEIEGRGRTEGGQPFAILKAAFGGHAAEARTIVGADGYYGHMLISRWPIRDAELHDISFSRREPRCAISAEVAAPAGVLRVFSTHFGLQFRERRWQSVRLANLVAQVEGPVLVAGDFNEWGWRGAVGRALSPILAGRTRLRTYPAWHPSFALDRIYCRPAAMLGKSWTDPACRKASDHLALIAEINLPRLPVVGVNLSAEPALV
jgi:endonuclease/exonuclease/phosphatase family metal-dependent hydrolase